MVRSYSIQRGLNPCNLCVLCASVVEQSPKKSTPQSSSEAAQRGLGRNQKDFSKSESKHRRCSPFQPRVELWQPWDKEVPVSAQTLKGFANVANPFRVSFVMSNVIPGLPKLNPGLELANTFGVNRRLPQLANNPC